MPVQPTRLNALIITGRDATTALSVAGTAALESGAATATAGAATLATQTGAITSEAITTAAGANYTLTLTNSKITALSTVVASVAFGTSTTGDPGILRVTPAAGSVVIIVRNHASAAALNGTIVVSFITNGN